MSLWKKGKPLFPGKEYAGLSQMALWYIGGVLKHAKALCGICNPTTNSYKRLVPGYEAPVNLAYSARNRSAAIRIPTFSESPKAKRIEYRPPDGSSNIYLTCAALMMAGLDGVINKIDPGEPMKAVSTGTLWAEAKEQSRNFKLGTYAVDIRDDKGDLVAQFQGLGYLKKEKLSDFYAAKRK